MPTQLLEINNNIQRLPYKTASIESSRISSKRHSLNSSDGNPLPLSLVKRSPRFMADTFASNSARRTPPPSKLPRRSLTPTLSTTMGNNGKTRNWVASTANRIGIGYPEVAKQSVTPEAEDVVPKIKSSSLNGLYNNALHQKPLPSPPVVRKITTIPRAEGESLVDASAPSLGADHEGSEPQSRSASSPGKSGRATDMKEIAQKDPAEQFPVLGKSRSDRSLSSSASTVKVVSEGASEDSKLVEEKPDEYSATTNNHELDKFTGRDQTSVEDSEPIVHKDNNISNPINESETASDEASDIKVLKYEPVTVDKDLASERDGLLEEDDYPFAESQVFEDTGKYSTDHCCEPLDLSTNISDGQDPPVIGGGSSPEENLFSHIEATSEGESQSTYRTSISSQDDSSYATATQWVVNPYQSPQNILESDSITERNDDTSDTLSTIYSAPSSDGSPACNRIQYLKDDHSLPEQRCTPSNFSRLKPKSSFHSLSIHAKQDVNDICRTRRLSPYYAGDECGPVLTVREEAEDVIMGANEDGTVTDNGRWNSCRRKLSYNAMKRRSQSIISEKNIDIRGKSQFDFNFSKEDVSSDEQTLANNSSPNSPELCMSTEAEGTGNGRQDTVERNIGSKGSMRTSSLRSNAKVYERKERPVSVIYPEITLTSTPADKSITSFPPRVSSLSSDTVINSKGSTSGSQQTAADAPVVRLNRQSLRTESSSSINKTNVKPYPAQGIKNSSRTKVAMSNIRGLFHRSPGNSRNNQKVSQAHTAKSLRVDAKGSPLYTSRTPTAHQSNIAAKRLSVQKSASPSSPSPIVYTSSRNPSFSKTSNRTGRGRTSSEPQGDPLAEVSALIETILDRAYQTENIGESSMLLAVAQILVQAATTAKTCESKMILAAQAAREATVSYNMTLQNVKEVTRIVKQDESLKKSLSD